MALSIPILKPITSLTATSFVLSWSSVSNASSYVLYVARILTRVADADTGVETPVLSGFHPGYNGKIINGTRWEVLNLLPNTTYYVQLISKNSIEESPKPEPTVVGTPAQATRQTSRGLRVDYALKEFALQGLGYQTFAFQNLLTGATEEDGSYPEFGPTSSDVYAVAQFKDPQNLSTPKASSYLTTQILNFVKGFKGKISSVMSQLQSEFSSFTERSSNSTTKIEPNFQSPYAMFGSVYSTEYFLKDRTGFEPVPVKQDTFGYWTAGDYSSSETGPSNKVVKPQPIIYSSTEIPEPVNIYMDFLRVGTTFNIAVDSSGQGGLQNRPPSNVTSDTGFMIIVSSVNEPGRLFYVKTEKLN